MILPDVNILIYAFRADTSHHEACKGWLDGVILGDAQFGISPLVLAAVIRITTNGRIFRQPSVLSEAISFCNVLLSQPHRELVVPGERHWQIFSRLVETTDTRGTKISDAWFAALAIEKGCTWVTYDRDYARFPGLSWLTPS